MYERHYGLQEKPFNMTPDSRYFFPSGRHQDALNSLLYTIQERRGFVVLTGEVGAGKTTICRVLLNALDASTKTAVIRNTHLTAKDLIAQTLEELEVPYEPGTKRKLINQLNEFLVEQLARDINVVLIIDEAQNLNPKVLEEVRMLSNLETEREKLIQIILLGQPELRQKLAMKSLLQFRQRIAVHYHLTPLNSQETQEYILHRLRVAGLNGRRKSIFNQTGLDAVFELSGGVPRVVNALCDAALLSGYAADRTKLDRASVYEVAGEMPATAGAAVGVSVAA